MKKVHKAKIALGKAREVLEDRPEIFCELPKKSSGLIAKLEKVAPRSNFLYTNPEEDKGIRSDRQLLADSGGIVEVARNAKSAIELIPEVESSFRKESAEFQTSVEGVRKKEKEIRIRKYAGIIGAVSSVAVFLLSAVAIYAGYANSSNPVLYKNAIFGTIIGIGGFMISMMSLDKTIRSSNKSVENAIENMKTSLEEIKLSLEEIVCSVPFRF